MSVDVEAGVGTLYRARNERVEFVDVPELGYIVIDGHGAPRSRAFESAFAGVLAVANAAHFLVSERGISTRIMPPEAVFWVDGSTPWALDGDPVDRWHWKVMVMQPDPIDTSIIERSVIHARSRGVHGLDALTYQRWAEGPAAQTLHIGPYDAEGPTVEALRAAIRDAHGQPHRWHHEIYFSNPQRTHPAMLRTLIRQPIMGAERPVSS